MEAEFAELKKQVAALQKEVSRVSGELQSQLLHPYSIASPTKLTR